MEISWQESFAEKWLASAAQARLPHAVLLAGPPGVGKRAAAVWMVAHKLGCGQPDGVPTFPFARPQHADLHWIEPPDGKSAILIDQLRALVADLSLTSYHGRGKAAVIEPANAMTGNAANSLLKTLEEPSGDALLILIADRTGRLPATIFSRCQRIDFPLPPPEESLAWLNSLRPGSSWHEALRVAGDAPLAAIAASEQLDISRSLTRDLEALSTGESSPMDIAAAWAKIESGFVFLWLARQVQHALKVDLVEPNSAQSAAISKSVLQRMDRRNLFCYLDIINRLRAQPDGSYNVQLTLEGLLIDWASGLSYLRRDGIGEGMLPRPPTRSTPGT